MTSFAGHTKLDNRIRTLIENGVATGHRSMFAIVGDKARDQIMVLHHILTKSLYTSRPSVLWCYKKDLGFSSHRKKRARELKVKGQTGNVMESNPLDIFLSTTQIRYCYYSETKNILGNTYGMVILQDFEALTPNLLARTIETVEGGGLVVFIMKTVNSLRQLYTLAMDVHNRYRTSASGDVVARFNERFILSLSSCPACVVIDDKLNVLPISSHINKIQALPQSTKKELSPQDLELKTLKESMRDTKPIGPVLNKCRTLCQGKTLLRLLDVLTDKSLNVTCSITAARGRGKSAAMGLSLAAAIAFGYTNVFVTSPSPENLKTLFQFIVKGFEALEWQEHADYELIQSTNPEFNKAVVRINVTREHRQTIQYIHPSDSAKLGQAELLVIDEAAAIPLPLVKELISGPYMVFLASTINGYEGTGRSLSLKLLQQLRLQSQGGVGTAKAATSKGKILHEMTLEESIRYKAGDPVEAWLNRVLCLDAPSGAVKLNCGTPPPRDCELYYVNRDTLFSFHKASEAFLHQVMSIYVSAHYKNTPNDLQMLSDAPQHHLFVLMAPVAEDQTNLPQVLAIMQVCLEGNIDRSTVHTNVAGRRIPAGDLVPWTISQNFQDSEFPTLCGGRIVRVAVHPDYQSMGYGTRALALLEDYFMGRVPCILEDDNKPKKTSAKIVKDTALGLLEEQVAPRSDLPPLLQRLQERKAEKLDYLGVSFGLTMPLLRFWKRAKYVPVYLRQSPNDITGEHTCIVLKEMREIEEDDAESGGLWLTGYWREFRARLIELLSFEFRKFGTQLAHAMLTIPEGSLPREQAKVITRSELSLLLSDGALGRLSSYAHNMADETLITDILPTVGRIYFTGKLPEEYKLSTVQAVLLVGLGLQRKSVNEMAGEYQMPTSQILAIYNKTMRKLSDALDHICEGAIRRALGGGEDEDEDVVEADEAVAQLKPLAQTIEEDLERAAMDIKKRQEHDKKDMLKEIGKSMQKYEITASNSEWEKALEGTKKQSLMGGTVSIKSKRKLEQPSMPETDEQQKPRKKGKMGGERGDNQQRRGGGERGGRGGKRGMRK